MAEDDGMSERDRLAKLRRETERHTHRSQSEREGGRERGKQTDKQSSIAYLFVVADPARSFSAHGPVDVTNRPTVNDAARAADLTAKRHTINGTACS